MGLVWGRCDGVGAWPQDRGWACNQAPVLASPASFFSLFLTSLAWFPHLLGERPSRRKRALGEGTGAGRGRDGGGVGGGGGSPPALSQFRDLGSGGDLVSAPGFQMKLLD